MNKILIAGITATLALSASAFAEDADLTMATGGEGGGYHTRGVQVAVAIEKLSKGKTQTAVDETNGSKENIELFNEGEADMFFAQEDALNVITVTKPYESKPTHQEAIYHFVNKDNDFTDVADYEGREDVFVVIVADSGSEVTWSSFVKEDEDYGKNPILYADDLWEAISYVSDGRYKGKLVGGAIAVTRMGKLNSELAEDFADNVRIGSVAGDKDFNDAENQYGDALYTKCELENNALAGFKTTSIFSDPNTLCMNAVLAYDATLDRKIKRDIKKAIVRTENK